MRNIKFLSCTRNFRINAPIDFHVGAFNGNGIAFTLSNDLDFLNKECFTIPFLDNYGKLTVKNELSSFSYAFIDSDIPENYKDIAKLLRGLGVNCFKFHGLIRALLSFLWIIKDNSICVHTTFAFTNFSNAFMDVRFPSVFYDSEGESTDLIIYTPEEVQKAYDFWGRFQPFISDKEMIKQRYEINEKSSPQDGQIIKDIPDEKSHNTFTRMDRAWMFLETARGSYHLPYRVSLCIPVLECLFLYNDEAIKETLSNRVAKFIATDETEYKSIEDLVIEVFKIRSKVLRGDKLGADKTSQFLKALSKRIDELLRKVFVKILTTDRDTFLLAENEFREFLRTMYKASKKTVVHCRHCGAH